MRSFTERVNTPIQGTGADGQKLALALLYERRHECPGAFPIACVHDEVAVECGEGDVDVAAAWLVRAMKDGMAEILALAAAAGVPVEVEVETGKTWGGGRPWSPSVQGLPKDDETDPAFDEGGPVRVAYYIDYRDASVGNYPQIFACDRCAERRDDVLVYQEGLRPGEEGVRCELCGVEPGDSR